MSYTASDFNPKIINEASINGVRYVDPNPTGEIVPLEDLFIYVSLKAKQKTKTVLLAGKGDNTSSLEITTVPKNTIDIVVPQQQINAEGLFKSKPALTTDWTEIGGFKDTSGSNLYKDFEGFGITNIDIEIKSQSAPKIVIDFVDVRGATLFEQGTCSPYGLFFNLPYPIFDLTVKGYYGKAITYSLNLIKFTSKFNSDTGNMECRGEFIGYTFAFLSDMLVRFIQASQNLPRNDYQPQEKLEEKYKKTAQFYEDNNFTITGLNIETGAPWCNNPNSTAYKKCTTIYDLLNFLNVFDLQLKPKIAGSDQFIELNDLIQLQKTYDLYYNALEDLIKELNAFFGEKNIRPTRSETPDVNSRPLLYVMTDYQQIADLIAPNVSPSAKSTLTEGILTKFFNKKGNGLLKNSVSEILRTKINNNWAGTLGIKCQLDSTSELETENPPESVNLFSTSNLKNKPWFTGVLKLINYVPAIDNEIEYSQQLDEELFPDTEEYIIKSTLDLGFILQEVIDEKKKLDELVKEKQRTVINAINDIATDQLGFFPSIRNIFTVLLCNTDAFIEILLEVAIAAENWHDGEKLQERTDRGSIIISGKNKVYPWPTYMTVQEVNGKKQGTKEKFPGQDFPSWPEVKFVEDFIKALLKTQEQIDVLNLNIEDKPGFDNFAPINPLESRYWDEPNIPTELKYHKEIDSGVDNYSLYIGERLFITLDHSHFQPIRLTNDSLLIPKIGEKGNNWNPLLKEEYVQNLGKIDAWNLVNSLAEDSKLLDTVVRSANSQDFISTVKTELKERNGKNGGYWLETNGNLQSLLKISPNNAKNAGANPNEKYYIFKTNSDGITLKEGKIIRPNPHTMEADLLIKIIKPEEQGSYKEIEIRDDKFKEILLGSGGYKDKIIENTTGLNFSTVEFKPNETKDSSGTEIWPTSLKLVDWDDKQQIVSYQKPQFYTTLAMSFYDKGKITWFPTTNTNSMLNTINPGGNLVSNMGVLSFWNNVGDNSVSLINLLKVGAVDYAPALSDQKVFNGTFYTDAGYKVTQAKSKETEQVAKFTKGITIKGEGETNIEKTFPALDGFKTLTLVTSPLWLDNANGFRKKVVPNSEYNSEYEKKNLAYLFLSTLKTTPLVKRIIDENGYLYNDRVNENQKQSSIIWSLRAFNNVAGVAKVPKAWLLTLGSQLWRWGEFLNGPSNNNAIGTWNRWKKPIPAQSQVGGEAPIGKDPLIQPGYDFINSNSHRFQNYTKNTTNGVEYSQTWNEFKSFRNNKTLYLNSIYGENRAATGWASKFSSVFPPQKESIIYDDGDVINGTGVATNDKFSFYYLNFIKNNFGEFGKKYLTPISASTLVTECAWPLTYIAPHHIPYISPEIFDNGNKGRGADFCLLTNDWVGFLDYNTLMPVTKYKYNYLESGIGRPTTTPPIVWDNTKVNEYIGKCGEGLLDSIADFFTGCDPTFTVRTKKMDGNLGFIIQNIPDGVKNIIVKEFEDWAMGEEWGNLLEIIDPVNFGNKEDLLTTYAFQAGENSPVVAGYNEKPGNNAVILALKNDDSLKKLFTDEWWVVNSTPKIWYGITNKIYDSTTKDISGFFGNGDTEGFVVREKDFNTYLTAFYTEWTNAKNDVKKRIQEKNKGQSNGIGDTILQEDDTKLALYRTFKSLTDKWVSASEEGKLFFNVINNEKGYSCSGGGAGKKSTLSSHFTFVNRVMGDIGDISVIDITKLNELKDNPKISLYQYISDVLVDNDYLFFPLPTYINFMTNGGVNAKDLVDMFKPSLLDVKDISCGPLFVCMYVGGTSRQLKFKTKVNCPIDQDALDNLEDDSFTWGVLPTLPDEISNPDGFGGGYTAFKILYGLDNQNHFKNIQLDQSEFSETAESLLVVDRLSQQGGAEKTTKGQNLNTAYLTRSYTCQVESLGNMMLQPMTYFDLQGVPMFSGAYLITEVRHNFKPNNATTSFKGTRQPRATVPIVTDIAIAMNLSFESTNERTGDINNLRSGEGSNFRGGVIISKVPRQPGGTGKKLIADTTAAQVDNKSKLDNYGTTIGITDKTDDASLFKLSQPNKPIGNIVNSAYANINVSTRTIPGTQNPDKPNSGGALGCAAAVSIIFYRATGYALVGESAITLGTSQVYDALEKESGKNNSSWEKITDWKTGCQAGDIICTARGSKPGHVGVVVLNNDIVSNSSSGFEGEQKGQIEKNYTIKGWDEVAKRNPNKTACFRYKGPYADSWGALTNSGLSTQEIYKKLNSSIQNPNLVYGIMGNIQAESGFNTNAKGDKRTDTGLNSGSGNYCSWGYTQINVCGGAGVSYLKGLGLEKASDSEKINALTEPNKHLDFVIKEVGRIYGGLPVTQQDTVENWTKKFAKDYERCSSCSDSNSSEVQKRVAFAGNLSSQIA